MAKFVIECPSCGRFVEASTGFFAKKKIDCSCGYTIDVKADRLSSRECPHCGNTVVYDQSKGDKATCPVCHEKINTKDNLAALVEFTCPSCACKLSADKNAATYTCPLCETEINVQERVKKEEIKKQGMASVIKYEGGNDTFVWKHPIEDFNLGSQLIVHESQEAIFFRDGKALDLFGSGRYTLATQNIPLLEKLYKIPSNTDEVFHSEIYFINMTTHMGIKWGTDTKIRLFDPASGLHIEIGACGNFSLKVSDSRKLLLKLVGTMSEFNVADVAAEGCSATTAIGKFKPMIISKVKANFGKVIKENNIDILEVDSYIEVISEQLKIAINQGLEEYGLYMPEFFITNIRTPDEDPDFQRLKKQFAERTLKTRDIEIKKVEAQLKMAEAEGDAEVLKIKAQAEADAYRAQALAEAEEMRMKGYTYGQETSRMVGMEAMKNGIGGEGGGGSALGDIASLGVTLGAMGGVVNMTKEAINPMMQTGADIGGAVIPPQENGWSCACGKSGITTKFCPECGSQKPEEKQGWTCACGKSGITTNFCPDCGAKKPEEPKAWDCKCGQTGITTKFCPECGSPKPEEPKTWDCECGCTGITTKFCPECGHKKEEE